MTVFAHLQTTNKRVNEAANDSAQVSGQDRKIPPALGTNQIAGFGGFRPLASLENIILFWTPRGQLPRNKRIIPVTNIAELLEYVILPHNNDVTKLRALNTFQDGLTELGIDKGLIKNKKLRSDLIKKKKATETTKILSRTRAM